MSQKKQARRNFASQAPLTPNFASAVIVRERIVPDLKVEEFWYLMYLEQKRKSDELLIAKKKLAAQKRTAINWRKVKKLVQLKPHSTREQN
jgi:hypothetical protein